MMSNSFLHKIAKACPPKDDVIGTDSRFDGSLEKVLSTVKNIDVKQSLHNIYLSISTADGHDGIYFPDPSSSCIGALEDLELMAQIVRAT
jgi:hypothetical protein